MMSGPGNIAVSILIVDFRLHREFEIENQLQKPHSTF